VQNSKKSRFFGVNSHRGRIDRIDLCKRLAAIDFTILGAISPSPPRAARRLRENDPPSGAGSSIASSRFHAAPEE
jgi:hypothetical protein